MTTNIQWKDKVTNTKLYRDIPKVSQYMGNKTKNIATIVGHCIMHTDELSHNLILR